MGFAKFVVEPSAPGAFHVLRADARLSGVLSNCPVRLLPDPLVMLDAMLILQCR